MRHGEDSDFSVPQELREEHSASKAESVIPELLEILGPIRQIEVIASGRGMKIRKWLKDTYGGKNWRKLKGVALVRDTTNKVYEAEIHWFECHGVGRRRFKIKRP